MASSACALIRDVADRLLIACSVTVEFLTVDVDALCVWPAVGLEVAVTL